MDTRIQDLVDKQRVITFSSEDTVADAIDKLGQANISSAPVLGADGKPIGFVDVLDILAFLVRSSTKPLHDRDTAESRYLNTDDARMLNKRAKDFKLAHVGELVDFSKRNPVVTIDGRGVVGDAVSAFAAHGAHRMAVTNPQGMVLGILTQSMILRHLEDSLINSDKLKRFYKDIRAADLKMTPWDKMVLVAPKCPAIDAFMTMFNNGVSSVAIIEGRELLGNISASDLKSDYARDFSNMLRPVSEWLKECHQSLKKDPDYLVTCTQDTFFSDMIHRLNRERVHRIFVVDHLQQLTRYLLGVISLTDLLRTIDAVRPQTSTSLPVQS